MEDSIIVSIKRYNQLLECEKELNKLRQLKTDNKAVAYIAFEYEQGTGDMYNNKLVVLNPDATIKALFDEMNSLKAELIRIKYGIIPRFSGGKMVCEVNLRASKINCGC